MNRVTMFVSLLYKFLLMQAKDTSLSRAGMGKPHLVGNCVFYTEKMPGKTDYL